jgi:glycosyltransferase involved in cell wall biosynthesis
LRGEGLDIRLVIAGEDADSGTGQYRRDLETLIAELSLQASVQLPGAQPEAGVRRGLEAAHVFALTSDTEAMPIVLVEAMAMGVPVITTDVGGTTELVKDNENGIVVPPGDLPAIVAAIRRITADPVLAHRFSSAGRVTVEAGFGSERSAATITNGLKSHGAMSDSSPA